MITGIWRRLQDWREGLPEKRALRVDEVFYRLDGWQRVLLVGLCAATLWKFFAPVIIMNVAPHYAHVLNPDWSVNWNEWTLAENQSAGLAALVIGGTLLSLSQVPLVTKPLILAGMLAAMFMNLQNGAITQSRGHDERTGTNSTKNEAIQTAKDQLEGAKATHAAMPRYAYTTPEMLAAKKQSADDLYTASIKACPQVYSRRRPRSDDCRKIDADHAAAALAYNRAITDEAHTRQDNTYLAAIEKHQAELVTLGAVVAHVDETSLFTEFLIEVAGVSKVRADALAKFKPVTDTIGAELFAAAFAVPTCVGWFVLFGLFTVRREKAEERVQEVLQAVSEQHAARLIEDEPIAKVIEVQEVFPHAEALGIDEPAPAFVEDPKSDEEALAAAVLKTAKAKKPRAARKKVEAHPSSVVQWKTERCFSAPGRVTLSTTAFPDYVSWCNDHNLTPVEKREFGEILRTECGVQMQRTKGPTKYFDLGIRAAHLRVVA